MKHLVLTVFLSSVLAASAALAQTPAAITGTVIGVTDGDTLTILDANKVRSHRPTATVAWWRG